MNFNFYKFRPRKPNEDSDEEDFYYTEFEEDSEPPSPPSPPTLSHRDMARPPHEDPEYQRQIVGNYRQGLLLQTSSAVKPPLPTSQTNSSNGIHANNTTIMHHNYSWSQTSPVS